MRGHPANIDFIHHYSIQDNLDNAKNALQRFLERLDHPDPLSLVEYKQVLLAMTEDIVCIGEFYGQRIPLLAACSGIIFKNNLRRATFAYPVSGSLQAMNRMNEEQQQLAETDTNDPEEMSITARLEACHLHTTPDKFEKIAKLVCWYCGLEEDRMNWAENMFCEGFTRVYGPMNNVQDYVYPNQSLFWIFRDGNFKYQVKEKKYNEKTWVPLQEMLTSID